MDLRNSRYEGNKFEGDMNKTEQNSNSKNQLVKPGAFLDSLCQADQNGPKVCYDWTRHAQVVNITF